MKKILFGLLLIVSCFATFGVDIAGAFDDYSCFKDYGVSFVITRGYCSPGLLDFDGRDNLVGIRDAGLTGDVYFFPCASREAEDQVDEFVDYYDQTSFEASNEEAPPSVQFSGLRAGFYGVERTEEIIAERKRFLQVEQEVPNSWYKPLTSGQYGTVWLDVEDNPSSACSWDNYSYESNCQFLGQLIDALQKKGKTVGIYSSGTMWENIFGSYDACSQYSHLPLWYAHYDGVADFSDWPYVSFGGWSKPAMKQYKGDTTLCGEGVDYNFY